jgi:hypothetical protein
MRRYLLGAAALALALALGVGLVACPATHGDYPGASCEGDRDCFTGERCELTKKKCEPIPPDMAMDMVPPFIFDLSHLDLDDMTMTTMPDATPPEDM